MSQVFKSDGTASFHKGDALNPIPYIAEASPDFVVEDDGDTTVTLTGGGFLPTTTAEFDGVSRTVNYISSTEVEVELLAADFTTGGFFDLTLSNPPPGGGTGVPFSFQVISASWTPALITTQLWLDANDSGTITIGTGVSQWDDKSGNSRHVTQATGANQPAYNSVQLNGKAVLSFDGTDDCLRRTTGLSGLLQNIGAASIYVVYRQTSAPTAGGSDVIHCVSDNAANFARAGIFLTGSPPESGGNGFRLGGKRLDAEALSNHLLSHPYSSFNLWKFNVSQFDYTNSDAFLYENGVLLGSTTSFATAGSTSNTTPSSLNVGCDTAAAQTITGNIAEMIITHVVSTSERQLIEGYLAWKWGLEANLPAGHPYENFPP